MDCCNYVQPYAAAGHFYQQQHQFCYENMNAYAPYGTAPISGASIEANDRYNCRLPPAYPIDYVYNPKEARLRKAMREQTRELSRQSILQTMIGSPAPNGGGGEGVGTTATPGSYPGHGSHPLGCGSPVTAGAAAVSPLPGSQSIGSANRIIGPWFPVSHAAPPASHLKPALSPRVMAPHQRTMDKEAIRKLECGTVGGYPGVPTSSYPGDFSSHASNQENNEYFVHSEFGEGQKWHPYQNGANAYHARGVSLSKLGGGLHRSLQSTNPHEAPSWSQFCGLPLSPANQSPMLRASRNVVFLREQQQQSPHCGYPDEIQLPYVPTSKVQSDHAARRLHTPYSTEEQQQQQHQPKISPLHISQLQEEPKCMEEGPRWTSTPVSQSSTSDGKLQTNVSVERRGSRERDDYLHERQEQQRQEQQLKHQQQQSQERQKREAGKQPLPGFQQAFGSTEIGRFSRSEYFANMVSESGNSIKDGHPSPSSFPFSSTCASRGNRTTEELLMQFTTGDGCWFGPVRLPQAMGRGTADYAVLLNYAHRLSQESPEPVPAHFNKVEQQRRQSQPYIFNSCKCSGHDQESNCTTSVRVKCPCADLVQVVNGSAEQPEEQCLDLRAPEKKRQQAPTDQEVDTESKIEPNMER